MNAVVLIPAYEPTKALVKLIKDLALEKFEKIVIVNDGSHPDKREIFESIGKISKKIKILKHAVNMGKGAALKTGFNYILLEHPNVPTIVTADADGQHKVSDIVEVAQRGLSKSDSLIIGTRQFSGYVPLRSRFGNSMTKKVFWFFSGISLNDTQSGLRAVPLSLARRMMTVKANGYEFEMEMLVNLRQWKIAVEEEPIETIYETGNVSSHFNPLKDSTRIYFVFIRYTFSSIASFAVDYLLFLSLYGMIKNVYYSTYIARSVSMVVNYNLNKKTVFKNEGRTVSSFLGYLILAVLSAFASALLTDTLFRYFGVPLPIAKIFADSFLYFLNFAIQREVIFKQSAELSAGS